MEIALSDGHVAPPQRLMDLRAGLYVLIGILMIAAAVARPEARLIAVAVVLSAAMIPSMVPTGHAMTRLEAAILSDILAGTMAWVLFPSDPIFGMVIVVWGIAIASFLVDRRSWAALVALAFFFEVAKVPFAAVAAHGWLPAAGSRAVGDVAITSAVGVVTLGLISFVFRNVAGFLSRSRTELELTQERYRSLVESAPTPVLVLTDDTIQFVNTAACEMLGEPSDRAVGRSLLDWLRDDDRQEASDTFASVVEGAERVVVRDRTIVREDGTTSVVDASIAPVQFRGSPAAQIVLVDVTDRYRAQEALRVSEERFRSAFLHSATPIGMSEMDTRFSQVNNALCEMLGYTADELLAGRWVDVIHPDDVAGIVEQARESLTEGNRTFRTEVRMVTKGGEIRWVRLDVATLVDDDGVPTRFISLAHDVTEHRAAQVALVESEQRYRSLFERLPVALYRTRRDGLITDANPALAELLGAPLEKLVGGNAFDFYVRPDQRRQLSERLADERVVTNQESLLRRADGEEIWVRDSSLIVDGEGGSFYEGALVDVTARRNIEAALRARAGQQEAIAQLGKRALEGSDIETVLQSAVETVVDMLDVAGAAVVQRRSDGLVFRAACGIVDDASGVPSELGGRAFSTAAPLVVSSAEELRRLAPALADLGVRTAASVSIGSREGAHGALWALSTQDQAPTGDDVTFIEALTHVLAAAMERHGSRSRLEELVRSKDEFIAAVSHELRTPLTVVSGMAHELHDSWRDFGDEERCEFMDMLVDQSRDMSDLIEDLLVAARADIGKVTVTIQTVDVPAEVERVLSGLKRDVLKRISVDYHDAEVLADPVRFRQIVRNLVTNAIRYGGDEVHIAMGSEADRVFLSVADDGPGVPEADRERIFHAYHRAHASAGQPGSVGLGLTVSRTLAALMNGSLEYRNGAMSTFVLTLPAARAAAAAARQSSVQALPESAASRSAASGPGDPAA